jgi:hypothetical protein
MILFFKNKIPATSIRQKPFLQVITCRLLTVYIRIKLQLDLQADKSSIIVKGPFFPRVMNPRYRICGTNV